MPEHTAVTQAQFDQLADCLTQLRDEERILLNLRYIKNLSVVEIAEVVGKGEAAVRKRLLRSLQRLRKLMDEAMVG
jgi:RNA polymerase sigma-70 factor (ECF subfamily)